MQLISAALPLQKKQCTKWDETNHSITVNLCRREPVPMKQPIVSGKSAETKKNQIKILD